MPGGKIRKPSLAKTLRRKRERNHRADAKTQRKEKMEEKPDKELSENDIGAILVNTAINVHRQLGPGLLESVYEVVLAYELANQGLEVRRQVPVSILYQNIKFDEAFRADLVINGKVIVELKSLEEINKSHRKQLQTYLKLSNIKLGFILNFGATLMKEGIVRAVNGLSD